MIRLLVRVEGWYGSLATLSVGAAVGMALLGEFGLWMPVVLLSIAPLIDLPRVSPLGSTLPIHARTLRAARLIRTLIPLLGPCLVVLAISPLWQPDNALRLRTLSVILLCGLCTAAVDLLHRDDAALPPRDLRLFVVAVLMLFGLILIAILPGWLALGIVVAAFALTVRESITDAPTALVGGRSISAATPDHADCVSEFVAMRAPLWLRPLARSCVSRQTVFWLGLGLFASLVGYQAAFLVFPLSTFADRFRADLSWLGTLPLSARLRTFIYVAMAAFAPVAAMSVGLSINIPGLTHRSMGVGAPDTLLDYDRYESASRVPLAFWSIALKDSAPWIVAPWGEQHRAYQFRVFERTMYNPYSIVASSSEKFVEWQHARATTAVYGYPISRRDYEENRSTLPAHVTSSVRMHVLTFSLMMFVALLSLWLIELRNSARVGRIPLLPDIVNWLVLVPIFAPIALSLLVPELGFQSDRGVVQFALLRVSQWLPSSTVLFLLLAFVPPAAMYWLLSLTIRLSDPPVLIVRRSV